MYRDIHPKAYGVGACMCVACACFMCLAYTLHIHKHTYIHTYTHTGVAGLPCDINVDVGLTGAPTRVNVSVSFQKWGVNFGGWTPIGAKTIQVSQNDPTDNNNNNNSGAVTTGGKRNNATFVYEFPDKSHKCFKAVAKPVAPSSGNRVTV